MRRSRLTPEVLRLALLANPHRAFDNGDADGDTGKGEPEGKGDGGDDGRGGDEGKGDGGKPPWGSEEEFDADRAWTLIQNQRRDLAAARQERDSLKTKVTETDREKMNDLQRAQHDAKTASEELTGTKAEVARLRAAIKHGLDDDDLEFLDGITDPEKIEARAAKLAERKGAGESTNGDGGQRRTVPGKPRERLRGTNADPDPEETDPAKLAAKVSIH